MSSKSKRTKVQSFVQDPSAAEAGLEVCEQTPGGSTDWSGIDCDLAAFINCVNLG